MSGDKLSKSTSLKRLRRQGVRPATVIDVGFATGTAGLYGQFDDVSYLIIEPLEESRPFIERLKAEYPSAVSVEAAAGRSPGQATLVVAATLSGSSFTLKPGSGAAREVPVVRIDDVVAELDLPAPFLLKLDVQGFEIEALEGALDTLARSVAIIVEVSLWGDRKKRLPTFAYVVAWFSERGFVLYDVAQIVRRDLDEAITEMDLVFCPADSPLRSITRYKALPQTEAGDAHIARRRAKFEA